jgi:hypothetical protein
MGEGCHLYREKLRMSRPDIENTSYWGALGTLRLLKASSSPLVTAV